METKNKYACVQIRRTESKRQLSAPTTKAGQGGRQPGPAGGRVQPGPGERARRDAGRRSAGRKAGGATVERAGV